MKLTEENIKKALYDVKDPEIPTISVVDLGIVTGISVSDTNDVHIQLTPTFAGCPALKMMEESVAKRIEKMDHVNKVTVSTNFDVQWNTNMITQEGLKALHRHGLARPERHDGYIELDVLSDIACPFCGSRNTTLETPFGPTLCRSMHYCKNCKQAFEAFKPVT